MLIRKSRMKWYCHQAEMGQCKSTQLPAVYVNNQKKVLKKVVQYAEETKR